MSRWGYSWRWKEGTCNHANWVQIGLVDDSFITPPRGFLTAQLPANFATVVSHRALSLSMATITRSNSRDTFSTSFTCSRAGPRSLSSPTDAFITLKDRINFRFHESRFSSFHFLPLLLNCAINFSSPKNPKEGISKGTLASSSIFLRCKKKKRKIATNPSNPCSTPSGSVRQDPCSHPCGGFGSERRKPSGFSY